MKHHKAAMVGGAIRKGIATASGENVEEEQQQRQQQREEVEEEEEEEEQPAWRCLSLEAPSSSPGTGAVTLIGS